MDATQKHALEIGIRLCREVGYTGTTFEKIASESGMAVSALHEQWPTKSALLLDALLVEVHRDLVYPDTGDFEADMRTQLMAIMRVFTDPATGPYIARLLGEAQRGPAAVEEFRERVYRPNRSAARARFLSAQRKGQLRTDLDIDAAIDLTFAPYWFRLLLDAESLDAAYVEEIVALAIRGLRPAEPC
ncbi:MAG: TetR/AcrR family transcriptional regulator [Streptosporangiaceae bacterium]